jgi:hypothetical protein
MKSQMKKHIAAIGLCAALGTTSCVGPYNAFNSVAAWNSKISDSKFVNELAYLGLWFVPVYPLAAAGDALIFNSLEFWTGDNPIKSPEAFESQHGK